MDKPLNFNRAILARVRGKVNIYLPAIANNTAKIINPTIIKILKPLDNFFDEIFVINLNSK